MTNEIVRMTQKCQLVLFISFRITNTFTQVACSDFFWIFFTNANVVGGIDFEKHILMNNLIMIQ